MMIRISVIVAMDKNRLIGADNGLLWRLPDDMNWFVEKTMGKPVIMGRKTYESIPAKFRPLKGRHNIVLTRSHCYDALGATVVHSVAAALEAAGDVPEIIIGGGATLYAQLLPQTSCLYLTLVEAEFSGDAVFPEIDLAAWRETFRQHHPADERHAHSFTWLILERDLDKKESADYADQQDFSYQSVKSVESLIFLLLNYFHLNQPILQNSHSIYGRFPINYNRFIPPILVSRRPMGCTDY